MNLDLPVAIGFALLTLGVLSRRTHVPLMILAGCAGFVLSLMWAGPLYNFVRDIFPWSNITVVQAALNLVLFLLPPLMVGYHFRRTQSGKWFKQLVPAILWTAFTLGVIVHLLPADLSSELTRRSHIATQLESFLESLVLAAILVSLLELMGQRTRLKSKKGSRE